MRSGKTEAQRQNKILSYVGIIRIRLQVSALTPLSAGSSASPLIYTMDYSTKDGTMQVLSHCFLRSKMLR